MVPAAYANSPVSIMYARFGISGEKTATFGKGLVGFRVFCHLTRITFLLNWANSSVVLGIFEDGGLGGSG